MGIDSIARGLAGYAQSQSKDVMVALEQFPNGINYKGAVDYYGDLPASSNTLGDAYTVRYTGSSGTEPSNAEYAWGEYDGTEQWIQVQFSLAKVANTGDYNDLINKPVVTPELLNSVSPAWSKYVDGGETTPNITLPTFGTPIGTQTMIYSFTAASANASFTAPSDAMLISAEKVDNYVTGNTISYSTLKADTLYIIRFTCYAATVGANTHNYILLEPIGYGID